MSMRVQVNGGAALQAALRAAPAEVRAAASKAVLGTALELQADVKKSIQQGPASGKVYQKYNPRRTHRASAPGEAPMSDTGRLASSIFFDKRGDVTAAVGSSLVYAKYLEYGTSQIAQRPFFRPAAERARPKLKARLEAVLSRVMK